MPTQTHTGLYSEILSLPQLLVTPKATFAFFDQNDQLLVSPQEESVALKRSIEEDPFSFAGRITNVLFPGLTIIEIVPIAISPDDEVVVFIRLLATDRSLQVDGESEDSSMAEIQTLCRQRMTLLRHEIPLHEIEASHDLGWRLLVHRNLVKPFYYLLSNFLVKRKVLQYAAILSLDEQSLVCDVGCGYDDLAIDIAKKCGAIALLNDPVSKPLILMSRQKRYAKAIFTNENALELNMSRKADLLICKNILHHMGNPNDMGELFKKISTLSNAFVIIDPEDPKKTFLGRLWNLYYRKFLLDQGDEFIDFQTFQRYLTQHFPHAQVSIRKIRTIKGNFMAAFINKV